MYYVVRNIDGGTLYLASWNDHSTRWSYAFDKRHRFGSYDSADRVAMREPDAKAEPE